VSGLFKYSSTGRKVYTIFAGRLLRREDGGGRIEDRGRRIEFAGKKYRDI
jgi:hypothetical protein